jgi:hypothetical protein
MMQPGQRVIFSDNGVLSDITVQMSDPLERSFTVSINAAQDALYIASSVPFNHKWFELGAQKNDVVASVSVELWNNSEWQPAVDILDYTSVNGKTFYRGGAIQFATDIETGGWTRERLSADVTGIDSLSIYEMYWMRMKWSTNLTASIPIVYIGNRFSEDIDLYAEYPDLNNASLKTAWEVGKTTWDEQHALAADYIVQQLISGSIIWDRGQIMDWLLFKPASVHKTAEIIYGGFGPQMAENKKMARDAYENAIALKYFNVDKSGDGAASDYERLQTTQEMRR